MFNSSPSTLSAVIDAAIEQGDLDGHTITRNAVMDAAAPVLGRTAPAGTADVGRSLYLSFTFVPRTWHHDVSPGSGPEGYKRDSHDQPAQQFGGQVTWELHPKDQPGWEVSGQGQVAIFPDEAKGRDRLQSVAGGVQAALGGDLVDGLLQVAWINQALLGAARVQSKLDGIIRFQPVAQVATGGQFMFKIPGTDGRLQIGGQLAAQFTGAAGSHLPQTFDFTTGVTIQVQLGSSR